MFEISQVHRTPKTYLSTPNGWVAPGHEPLPQKKTQDETFLIPMISTEAGQDLRIKATLARSPATQTDLDTQSPEVISILAQIRSGFKVGAAAEYIPLPWHRRLRDLPPGAPCWRIELHGLGRNIGPMGLDILDDVVIGRGSVADIDFEPYRGYEQAVSRRHVLLRPTLRQLHLIDLGSTNGTLYNTVPVGRCATYPLKSDDVITLGLLSFTVKIVDGPLVARA